MQDSNQFVGLVYSNRVTFRGDLKPQIGSSLTSLPRVSLSSYYTYHLSLCTRVVYFRPGSLPAEPAKNGRVGWQSPLVAINQLSLACSLLKF